MEQATMGQCRVYLQVELENGHMPPKYYRAFSECLSLIDQKQVSVEPVVKPACVNCKHLHIEKIGALLRGRAELCQNPKLKLWNLTNCDINIIEFGCTYFESKSV